MEEQSRQPRDLLREKLRKKIAGKQQQRMPKMDIGLREKEEFDMMDIIRKLQYDKHEKGESMRVLRHKYDFLLKDFEPIFNMATREEPLTEKEFNLIENMLKRRENVYNGTATQDQATKEVFQDMRDMHGV